MSTCVLLITSLTHLVMDDSLPPLQLPSPESVQPQPRLQQSAIGQGSSSSLQKHTPSNLTSASSFSLLNQHSPIQPMQRSNSNYHPGSGRSSIDSSSAGSGAIAGPSHYIPPASNLTVSNHDRLLGVIEAEFKDTDRILERRDLKAFGANSERIFQELDKIRKKQLALAAKHISIETIADNDLLQTPDGRLLDADNNEIDPRVFARKGLELQELMTSLEDLGRAMSAFHDLSNSANKESSA